MTVSRALGTVWGRLFSWALAAGAKRAVARVVEIVVIAIAPAKLHSPVEDSPVEARDATPLSLAVADPVNLIAIVNEFSRG